MITGKLDYYGASFSAAVGVCTDIQSIAQNDVATEWHGRLNIYATEDAMSNGSPLRSYPLLGWVDNNSSPVKTLETIAIDLFLPEWSIVN